MKKTVIVCDRCEAVIERPAVTVEIQTVNHRGPRPKAATLDLCPECKAALESFLASV